MQLQHCQLLGLQTFMTFFSFRDFIIFLLNIYQMQGEVSESQIIQQLDRLRHFNSLNDPIQSIPPFFHTVTNLLKYAEKQKSQIVKQKNFREFYTEFQKFAKSDFSILKKNHELILDEIAGLTECQEFLQCLRPDIFRAKKLRSSLRRSKVELVELQAECYDYQNGLLIKGSEKETTSSLSQQVQNLSEMNQTDESQDFEFQDLFGQMELAYEEHSLDEAFRLCNEYLSTVENLKQLSEDRQQFVKKVIQEYEMMIHFYADFQRSDWKFDKQQNGITLHNHMYEDGSFALKVECEDEIPVEPFLSIISEVDLMDDYIPFCYGSKLEKTISRNQRIGTSKVYMPLLCDRQTFFYAAGYDRMKTHNSLFFFSKTIHQDVTYQKKYNFPVPQKSDYVRLIYDFFIIEYTPIGPNKAKIRLASKIDIKMDLVPKFIMFQTARIFAFNYFKNIIDRVKTFKGSPWQKRIEKNPDFYRFFHRKIDEHMSK